MTVERILIGTGNRKKLLEIEEILREFGIEFLVPADLDPVPPAPPEDGATFEENARAKALGYARATGMTVIADDSGLEVDALDGRPGVHSARYAGEDANDARNNEKLLRELTGVPESRRGAGYVSVVVLATPEEVLLEARGGCRGVVLEAPRGEGGFGYDPLMFIPELGKTYAELESSEKHAISHRGEALRKLREALRQRIAEGGSL